MKLIIDVSNRNVINGGELKQSGSVALICKATEGTSYQDKTLAEHRTLARNAHVPFGSYLFLHPDSGGSEAQFYLKYARPRGGDLQPIVDAEVTNLGTADLARRALSCLDTLEGNGYDPILYASAAIWQELIVAEPKLKRFRVWEADYPGRFARWFPRLAAKRIKLRHGVTVVMWQWTDAYAVGARRFDASALLTDIDNIRINAGL